MAKRQTRRAISVKGLTYQRLKKYCDEHDKSVAGFVEEIIGKELDARSVAEETVLEPRKKETRKKETPRKTRVPRKTGTPSVMDDFPGNHFTF